MSKYLILLEGTFGVFILLTVLFQNYYLLKINPNFSSINYYSYFTILSNILAGMVLILSASKLLDKDILTLISGSATLYTLITGLVFITILKGENDLFLNWVNITLHYIVPLVMLLNWFFVPHAQLTFQKSLVWIFFMILYLTYTLIRGAITKWYPYDFINPTLQGVSGVITYSIVITLLVLVLDIIILYIPKNSV